MAEFNPYKDFLTATTEVNLSSNMTSETTLMVTEVSTEVITEITSVSDAPLGLKSEEFALPRLIIFLKYY